MITNDERTPEQRVTHRWGVVTRRLIHDAGFRALWRDMGAYLSEHPVCPECARFIPAALWDQHMADHHETRVGLAEEAKAPPPHEEE